jgi:glutaminyl-tRNA synthetase
LEDGKVIDLDGKKWPDAPADDASSYYKVPLLFSIKIRKILFVVMELLS